MRQRITNQLGSLPIALLIAIGASQTSAFAQQTNPFFGDQGNAVRQVSLSEEADPFPEADVSSPTTQLTVSISYLLVDDETRRLIYEELDPESIRHSAYAAQESDRDDLTIAPAQDQVEKQIISHGHSATCVVDSLAVVKLLQLVEAAPQCTVSQAPSLILQQNQTAEINDIIQRPMMVDAQQELGQLKPVIQVVEQGTRMRLLARLVSQPPAVGVIELTAEFVDKRIIEVNSIEVLGLQDQPTTLKHPVCAATKVVAREQLAKEQLLLIDPHIKRDHTIEVDSTSMLGRLPLVGKSFASTESQTIQHHLMVLIKPAVF